MIKLSHKYRIYGRTKGRKKIKFFDNNFFKDCIINLKKDINENKKTILDIGSGNGENSILLAKKNPDALIIACDIFQDGNINLCNNLFKLKLNNTKLFTGNVIKLFDQLKLDYCFNEVWILFPDPWPKNRHHKRRLIKTNFFKRIHPLLKNQSKIFISTDSTSYLISILNSIYNIQSLFRWLNDKPQNWIYEKENLPHTKFFIKAKDTYKPSFFIELEKIS